MTRALVTGGSGFLGRRLIELLLQRGYQVRTLIRQPHPGLSELGAETVIGSLESRLVLLEACRERDVVFHCAAKAGVWGEWGDYHRVNVEGTVNLLEACRHCGVSRFIYTSSPSVTFKYPGCSGGDETLPYPETFLNFYTETKAAAEKAALQAHGWGDMATTALRPHLIYGPNDPHLLPRLLEFARQGRLTQVGDGTNKVDVTFIDNAVGAHIQAAERLSLHSPGAGKAYFVSDGHPVNLWDWIGALLQDLGLPPVSRHLSVSAAFRLGALMEWGYRTFRLSRDPHLTRFVAYQLGLPHYYSIEAARRDFGYAPPVEPGQARQQLLSFLEGYSVRSRA